MGKLNTPHRFSGFRVCIDFINHRREFTHKQYADVLQSRGVPKKTAINYRTWLMGAGYVGKKDRKWFRIKLVPRELTTSELHVQAYGRKMTDPSDREWIDGPWGRVLKKKEKIHG